MVNFDYLKEIPELAPQHQLCDLDQRLAIEGIERGDCLFITGKAGTGKTTLLRRIRSEFQKKKVIGVVAPTGVAAENAGGVTMHSLLRLPLKPYLPEHRVCPDLFQLNDSEEEVLRSLDLLIIDEVSMVRCDMMDATDQILRHYRKEDKPFGGLQIVMFGDLYQLSPVANSDDAAVLRDHYTSFYFFCSRVLNELPYRVIELKKVYRQSDDLFVGLLNRVRDGKVNTDDLKVLESRYEPAYMPQVNEDIVTLMTHNWQTKNRNGEMFEMLPGDQSEFKAKIKGAYWDNYPAPYYLKLKIGTRVMFLRNDNEGGKYVNGTMGWVIGIGEDLVTVRKDNGDVVAVTRVAWDCYSYRVDKKTKTIYTEVVGTFSQFPFKQAWAVTIHKSQGMTFDEVAIDAAKAFASGQVYVALSRCRTLDGLHLISKIPSHKMTTDPVVEKYIKSIDADGYAHAASLKAEKFEACHLKISVRNSRYEKIVDGELKQLQRKIDSIDMAKQIFEYDGDKIIVNRVFEKVQSHWTYRDQNGGNCPFIIRKYRFAEIESWDYPAIRVQIGPMEITSKDGFWLYKFRIEKIIK